MRVVGEASKGTFGVHLEKAKSRGVISNVAAAIAADLNNTRNNFLHWMPGRSVTPTYKGKDVTREEGMHLYLNDALRVLHGD